MDNPEPPETSTHHRPNKSRGAPETFLSSCDDAVSRLDPATLNNWSDMRLGTLVVASFELSVMYDIGASTEATAVQHVQQKSLLGHPPNCPVLLMIHEPYHACSQG